MTVTMSAYRRFHTATQRIRDENTWPSTVEVSRSSVCSCCTRPFDAVEDPGEAVMYRYSAGQARMSLCTTCFTPKHGSYLALGVERRAGTSDKTVAGKLGMLPACGAVITTDNQLHLSMPAGFVSKFKDGSFARDGLISESKPDPLFWDLYRTGGLDDIDQGIVVIAPLGRKSLNLMANLRLTSSLAECWINSDQGVRVSDRESICAIADWATKHDRIAEVCSPRFWSPIRAAAQGQHDQNRLAAWGEHTPDPADLISRLPDDPHDRLALHLALKSYFGR